MKKINSNRIRDFSFGFVLALLLLTTIAVYAQHNGTIQRKWRAFWHGTDWIGSGEIIEGQKIAENLEYLKQNVEYLKQKVESNEIGLRPYMVGTLGSRTFDKGTKFIEAQGLARTIDSTPQGAYILIGDNKIELIVLNGFDYSIRKTVIYNYNEGCHYTWKHGPTLCVKRNEDGSITVRNRAGGYQYMFAAFK